LPQTSEVVVRLTISEEDFDVTRLEEGMKQRWDEAGRELLVRVLAVLEEEALAARVFPGHVFQLDRWHLLHRLAQFAGHLPRLWKRLRRWVYEGRFTALARSLRHLVGADQRSEQARQAWLGYVTRHAEAITAVDRRRPRVSPAARPLLTHGTGAMEKNIETVVGGRFPAKRDWGMRWTRRGAHHRLKLRLWIARYGTSWFEALHSRPAQLPNA
jgi:hypothetical protein